MSNIKKAHSLSRIGVSLWISFLFAGIATMLFFAAFDPKTLAENATFPLDISREAGYTLGFLLFWLLLLCNSVLVLHLSHTSTHKQHPDWPET